MRIVLVCGCALLLAGCGGSGRRTDVVAAFYPLAYAAQAVGGESLRVRNVTPAGAEPHDIELTPQDVVAVERARLVIYLSHGFQPALEHAVRDASGRRLDALAGLPLHSGEGGGRRTRTCGSIRCCSRGSCGVSVSRSTVRVPQPH